MSTAREVKIYATADELASGVAELFIEAASHAIAVTGVFRVALSGGSTPRLFLRLLATSAYAGRVDWSKVHLFWGDERCVPPMDAASNYRMASCALIDHVPIPPEHVHRMEGEREPSEAAAAYDALLRDVFNGPPPHFDLVLLGLGDNGHAASLFPGQSAVRETERWVVAEFIEDVQMSRITLTPPVINASALVAFVVCGKEKARIVRRVIEHPRDVDRAPATAIEPESGRLVWLLDRGAALHLE